MERGHQYILRLVSTTVRKYMVWRRSHEVRYYLCSRIPYISVGNATRAPFHTMHITRRHSASVSATTFVDVRSFTRALYNGSFFDFHV